MQGVPFDPEESDVDRLALPDCIVDLVGPVGDGQRRKLASAGSNGGGRFCGGQFLYSVQED